MVVTPLKNKNQVTDFLKYLRGQNPRDALLFQIGVNTSLRISDLLRLQVFHVANKDHTIKKYLDIKEKKTKKQNRIIITSKLAIVLKAYITRYGLEQNDYLIFSQHKYSKENTPTLPITRDWASKLLVKAAEHLGIMNFNTQSMRKTHAYHVYMATAKNIGLVQLMLNHASPKTTLRYLCITQDEMDNGRELVSF